MAQEMYVCLFIFFIRYKPPNSYCNSASSRARMIEVAFVGMPASSSRDLERWASTPAPGVGFERWVSTPAAGVGLESVGC